MEKVSTAALYVKNVSHSFGDKTVLQDVSLSVPSGTFTVLLGLNGAGKSSLFSLITRLYDNVTGQICILGYDVRRKPTLALQGLGVVFQSRTLDSDLTLHQNLMYHAALHGILKTEAKKRSVEALTVVNLQDRAHEKVRNLSGGQARRVEIARSLLHRPGLLLLDEATVGLDIGSRENVVSIVRGLVKRERMGVLWATHLIDEINESDSIVVLHFGKVLFSGQVLQLLDKTRKSNVRDAFRTITGTIEAGEAA